MHIRSPIRSQKNTHVHLHLFFQKFKPTQPHNLPGTTMRRSTRTPPTRWSRSWRRRCLTRPLWARNFPLAIKLTRSPSLTTLRTQTLWTEACPKTRWEVQESRMFLIPFNLTCVTALSLNVLLRLVSLAGPKDHLLWRLQNYIPSQRHRQRRSNHQALHRQLRKGPPEDLPGPAGQCSKT